jgi:large subunit ribosomal protein L44e
MKLPRNVNMYCPKCGKHTSHEVERVKKKMASELKLGQRRFRRVTAGYGGFPRPKPEGREKPTRRVWLKYKCIDCKSFVQPPAQRSKKFEFTEE